MQDLVDEGLRDPERPDTISRGFGELLHEAWQAKRSLSARCRTPTWTTLRPGRARPGAIGGKLTGAGGGGFLLLFVPPDRHDGRPRGALDELIHVPFKFEFARQPDHLLRPRAGLLGRGAGARGRSHIDGIPRAR